MEQYEKVSCNSYQQGKSYFFKGNFGRAFAHFLIAIKLNPAFKVELKDCFSECLEKWGGELENKQKFDDLFNCYEQAIAVFPENELIYNNLGSVLLRCGSPKEAADYFRKYVSADSGNLRAVRNLENACNLAVERWHYRMLNDQLRNLSFREAIVKKVKSGFRSVLDIGTGTGILSLFALEGGANEVYACDSSSAMTAIASEVLQHHDGTSVKLLTKHSTDLAIPDDLGQRVSLVVCEIVDCGLLGEHVLETLVHAWEYLLEPNGVVLPLAAALHICGIQSKDISQAWVLNNVLPDLEKYKILASSDSYDTERLSRLPKGYTILTEVATPLTIDFNDPEEMQDVLLGHRNKAVTLKVTETGTLDCVAGWFTLRVDEDIALQTGPESPISCWEQAVFPSLQPIIVKPGDELQVDLSFQSGKLSLKFNCSVHEEKQTATVSQAVIKMLNNTKWIKALQATADHFISKKKSSIRILDLSPMPVLGLSILKVHRPEDQLVCTYSASHDKEFITSVVSDMGLERKVLCLPEEGIDGLIEQKQKFDVILVPVIEETGEYNERILSRLSAFRECLSVDGLFLPQQVNTVGQMVESAWLQSVSRVIDAEVTCGYDIAPFINKYSVDQQIDFRLEAIDKTIRSEPFQVLELIFDSCTQPIIKEKTVPISEVGQINAVVYWHEISLLRNNPCTKFTTTDVESHINQTAQLITINGRNDVQLLVHYDKGLMGMRLKEKD